MEELIQQVAAKAGISEDQARSAVSTVADFVKARVPAPMAAQIDSAMSGKGEGFGGGFGDLASKVGGLLG